MAINNNPIFAPGRRIPPELLKQWLDRAALGTMEYAPITESQNEVTQTPRTGWYDASIGQFSPLVERRERMQQTGNGESTDWTGTGDYYTRIYQPRNDSTWGANNVADVWDEAGNYLGTSSAAADARQAATILAMAAGGWASTQGGIVGQAGTGALKGAAAGGLMAGATDGDLGTGMLTGAAGGAITGGINAYGTEQGWNPATTKAVSSATTTALRGGDGGDILKSGLLAGASGSLSGSTNLPTTTGGNMGFNIDPSLYDNGGDFGTVLADNFGDHSGGFDFSNLNQYDFGFDPSMFNQDGSFNAGNFLKSLFTQSDGKGGSQMNAMLPMLLGGLLGAQGGKDQQATNSRAPWEPMQPYLLGLASDGRDLYNRYKAQPFSPSQQAGYANVGGLLDSLNATAPGLLAALQQTAGGGNQFVRGRQNMAPTYSLSGWNFQPQGFGDMGMTQFRGGR